MSDSTGHQPLFMIQICLDLRRLVELARALHLPIQSTDTSYITHCALHELFGKQAPGPFAVEGTSGKHLRVLGYASSPASKLQESAQAFASPMVYQIPDWTRFRVKPMPDVFPEGSHLGFTIRVCPVVRKASAGPKWSAGAEVDAFLSKVWAVDDSTVAIDRESVYREWLQELLTRSGAAIAQNVRLERFSLESVVRRNHLDQRQVKTIKRPAATLTGALDVLNGDQFMKVLRNGLGRHRAFGFGMLKLRRSEY